MKFRKLPIAVSAVSLAACVVVTAFWLRSYYWNDVYKIHVQNMKFALQSVTGRVCFVRGLNTVSFHQKITDDSLGKLVRNDENVFGYHFHGDRNTTDFGVHIPHSWLVLFSATLATAPWLRWRFSLRTLLIATTLVAVVLGLIGWMSRG